MMEIMRRRMALAAALACVAVVALVSGSNAGRDAAVAPARSRVSLQVADGYQLTFLADGYRYEADSREVVFSLNEGELVLGPKGEYRLPFKALRFTFDKRQQIFVEPIR